MFLIRVFSSAVLILLVLGLYLWLGVQGLTIVTSAVVLYGVKELLRMFWGTTLSGGFWLFAFLAIFCQILASILFPFLIIPVFAASVILCTAGAFFSLVQSADLIEQFLLRFTFVFFYLGILPSFVFRLLSGPDGSAWFVFHCATVFAGDTFAYFVGRTWGQRPLLLHVSPKKTWEGAAGGLAGSLSIGMLLGHLFFRDVNIIWFALGSLLIGVTAQMGDLVESLMKRKAAAKDSGRLIPGHGGVLDRVDGIILSAPIVYLLAVWIHHLSLFSAFD